MRFRNELSSLAEVSLYKESKRTVKMRNEPLDIYNECLKLSSQSLNISLSTTKIRWNTVCSHAVHTYNTAFVLYLEPSLLSYDGNRTPPARSSLSLSFKTGYIMLDVLNFIPFTTFLSVGLGSSV